MLLKRYKLIENKLVEDCNGEWIRWEFFEHVISILEEELSELQEQIQMQKERPNHDKEI